MEIVLDGFGGDNSPRAVVEGAVLAVNKFDDLKIMITGNKEIIENELTLAGYIGKNIEILNANSIISNNESPTVAIKTKKDSSLVVALDYAVSKLDDKDFAGLVSAGSTGAVLTGALLKIGRLKGIKRPALAPVFPNLNGGKTLLIDCGANMDSKPEFLTGFALLGSKYMQYMYNTSNPKISLLNVGVEDKKGNELTHIAFEKMSQMKDINFVGNMEARDIMSGNYDVVVSDGFAGNVALKSSEGTALFILKSLKKNIKSGGIRAKLGYLLLKKAFKGLMKEVDFNAIGGSPFLGVKCPVIKSHGSSDKIAILGSITLARNIYLSSFIPELSKMLADYDWGENND